MGAHDQPWTSAELFIAETPGPIISGLRTSKAMMFITVHCDAHDIKTGNDDKIKCQPIKDMSHLIPQYPNRFDGIDKFPGQYHIELKDDYIPVALPLHENILFI